MICKNGCKYLEYDYIVDDNYKLIGLETVCGKYKCKLNGFNCCSKCEDSYNTHKKYKSKDVYLDE